MLANRGDRGLGLSTTTTHSEPACVRSTVKWQTERPVGFWNGHYPPPDSLGPRMLLNPQNPERGPMCHLVDPNRFPPPAPGCRR